MPSLIQGPNTGSLEIKAGTGQSIIITTDAEGSVDFSQISTVTYTDNAVSTAVTNLVAGAPVGLDTLNEISAAIADDPDFAGTMNTLLLTKAEFTTPPTSSKGQAGDSATDIAIDNNFLYYCVATYTDGVPDIWARVALTLTTF